MLARIVASVALIVLVVGAGCSTGPPAVEDSLGGVPADFSVDLAVLAGADAESPAAGHARPGRFVIFCDGSLHWEPGSRRPGGGLPPRRRTLSHRQVAELWVMAQQLGLANPDHAAPPGNLQLIEPQPGRIVYAAVFTAGGVRWFHERRYGPDDPPGEAIALFACRLAELGWVGDSSQQPQRAAPQRHDFGPDPYARYRRP